MTEFGPRLAGKVALITGAARGQGLAIARLFLTHGCRVVLSALKEDAAQDLR